ncbi:putative kinesin light chain [Monocercomonoides exilis]|uniref:putative kinesin light chain n=1 Tax=Monocercomonoides exilis TaxID=2049356 RepID=UPI00355A5AD9|nr:putative kinesin light chain [Monocercomonoides exilis]|eukprot:MONOS_1541.1-p1 / transcript=MONOS_1541.1 / gene=MONOS_1541 / organism=Monocercomonoides_exilis_PA203 / gene_product=unspecified product / transcript_product=unspecified product / location=Mono_scaffold00027:169723-173772(+) / protein_length=947 / sequence_SO=supercontig / SO=protein_coding / is_pseudo=false
MELAEMESRITTKKGEYHEKLEEFYTLSEELKLRVQNLKENSLELRLKDEINRCELQTKDIISPEENATQFQKDIEQMFISQRKLNLLKSLQEYLQQHQATLSEENSKLSTIGEEWKDSPAKDPPISVVLKEHLGKGGGGESYKTIQVEANDYLLQGDWQRTIESCFKCRKKIISSLGPQSPELIYVYIMLCEAYTSRQQYGEAFEAIKKAGALLEGCPGITDGHIYRVYYLRDLGNLLRIQGKIEEALPYFQRVAETRRIYQGDRHPDTALALVDLGVTLKMMKQYTRALQMFAYALSVHEDGGVYLCTGRWKEAEQTLKQGVKILKANGMSEHPDIAAAECNLGIAIGKLERWEESLAHFERARVLREKQRGMTHPETAEIYIHIARQLQSQGRNDEAEQHLNRAMAILEMSIASTAQQLDKKRDQTEIERINQPLDATVTSSIQGNTSRSRSPSISPTRTSMSSSQSPRRSISSNKTESSLRFGALIPPGFEEAFAIALRFIQRGKPSLSHLKTLLQSTTYTPSATYSPRSTTPYARGGASTPLTPGSSPRSRRLSISSPLSSPSPSRTSSISFSPSQERETADEFGQDFRFVQMPLLQLPDEKTSRGRSGEGGMTTERSGKGEKRGSRDRSKDGRGEYATANDKDSEAKKIVEMASSSDDGTRTVTPSVLTGIAECQMLIGQILISKKMFDQARLHFKEAKELFQVMPGHADDVKEIDTRIANAFLTEGESGDALAIFENLLSQMEAKKKKKRELKRREREKRERERWRERERTDNDNYYEEDEDEDDESTLNEAAVLNGIGNAHRQRGNYEDALKFYERSLAIYERIGGTNDASTAIVHMNMGNTYLILGSVSQALQHFLSAKGIRERLFGAVHLQTASSLTALGAAHLALDQYDEAIGDYSAAADTLEVLKGSEDEQVLSIRHTIAEIIKERHKFKSMQST